MRDDDLSTAAHLLSRLGISIDELVQHHNDHRSVPTFGEYIQRLRTALPKSTVRNYQPYWRIVETHWGARALDEANTTEIDQLVKEHQLQAVVRVNARGGRGAAANMVSAIRCIYQHAEADRLIRPADNPATRAHKPPQLPSTRHALTFDQVRQIGHVAATTGNDRELDALIVRLHIETACRKSGVLALRVEDLNPEDCLIKLREKGGTERWQPISPLLMSRLLDHVGSRRGSTTTTKALRYRSGRPVGRRRYDYLSGRIRAHLPWANTMQVSAHWLRYTTLTFVEREFGLAVARAYAGHGEPRYGDVATIIYVRASLAEVAEALTAVTGFPHPLALTTRP
ncbi:tyrosine-type recombinase/integrase [Nocardia sp. SYP-A9097]|uniref:tyrosine-type recombinase/integrase n=1 Tax=Nocardia sp. SYP-A9097 TaxID=2663237 RepID=UPI00129A8084|nr:site-specific integrase [Nocardia sp. SYP-A9097]MRH88590.1 tyrosine-type recombinase/integrase [Nocardia sp. SYP-A9097]